MNLINLITSNNKIDTDFKMDGGIKIKFWRLNNFDML